MPEHRGRDGGIGDATIPFRQGSLHRERGGGENTGRDRSGLIGGRGGPRGVGKGRSGGGGDFTPIPAPAVFR